MPSKCLTILLDGLGDRSYTRYDFKTPLQAAHTPCLDSLARKGGNGLYHAAIYGKPLPSENAHFAMFGYDLPQFPGRGALEALGGDIELEPGDVAVLAHFVHVGNENGQLRLLHDRMCGDDREIEDIMDRVEHFEADGVSITFHQTKRLFGVVVLRGDVAPGFTDSNPMIDGRYLSSIVPRASFAAAPGCARAAAALTKYVSWVHRQLEEAPFNIQRKSEGLPPINGLVTQRAGQLRPHEPFFERYGMKGLIIASGVMYKGLARYLGLDFNCSIDSGDPGLDMSYRLSLAREAFDDYDFIHVHTKAPDQSAHTKNPDAKRKSIESLDKGIAEGIDKFLDDPEILIAVTADHSTPSSGDLIHSGEPVPLMFVGDGVRRDKVDQFDEISAATGCLGSMRGPEFMHMMLNYLDRARLMGIHDTPTEPLFWPGDFTPFTIED